MDLLSAFITTVLGIVVLALLFIAYMSRTHGIFKKLGIPYVTPMPCVGNFVETLTLGLIEFQKKYYKKFSNEKMYGFFDADRPVISIRDLDMIRDVMVKNFNSFVDRRHFANPKPFSNTMNNLRDDHWRHVRNTLTPTFSSGKLRRMSLHVEGNTKALVANLRESCQSGKELEMFETVSGFTIDVIASTGFGINLDSINDRSNRFARELTNLMTFSKGKIIIFYIFPKIVELLSKIGYSIFPKKSIKYFASFVEAAIENRANSNTNNQQPNDFLQLVLDEENKQKEEEDMETEMLELKDQTKWKGLSHLDVEAQAIIFMVAGIETVSNVLSFTFYCLAHNPQILAKVHEEIDSVLGGKFPTYDSVQNLHYLGMCLQETMRVYPTAVILDRQCTQECVLQGIRIPKGMIVSFPVYAIQHDPQHYPDPEKFDPERFSPENKANRHPSAYLPFGQGPRMCIGMRLALMELKFALAATLQKMTPIPSPKSPYPPRLKKYVFKSVDGLWLKMVLRKKERTS